MHYDAVLENTSFLQGLISRGGNPDVATDSVPLVVGVALMSPQDELGDHHAAALLRVLIAAKADVNSPSSVGDTPLGVACLYGANECVNVLQAAGADMTSTPPAGCAQ